VYIALLRSYEVFMRRA